MFEGFANSAAGRFLKDALQTAYGRAYEANNTPAVRAVMENALGQRAFADMQPLPDPLQSGAWLRTGTSPALYGDVLLISGNAADLRAFRKANGQILNRRGDDGKRPSDHMIIDIYNSWPEFGRGRDRYESDQAAWRGQVEKVDEAAKLGVKFDDKSFQNNWGAYRSGESINEHYDRQKYTKKRLKEDLSTLRAEQRGQVAPA